MKRLGARERAKVTRAIARFEAASRLHQSGNLAGAIAQYELALFDTPDFAPGHTALGLALASLGRLHDAETSLRRAVTLDPTLADAHVGLGKLREGEGDLPGAVAAYQTALRYDPKHQPAICEWWLTAEKLGRLAECVEAGRRYMAIKPEHREARWDLALQELAVGEIEPGWEGYAARWSHPFYSKWRYNLPASEWAGEDLTGKHIVVWREQGVGDEIMFASCLPDLIAAAGRVTLACTDRLMSIFARSFPQADVIDAKRIAPPNAESIDLDYHTAIGALPRFLRPTVASFPARADYLTADPARAALWRDRVASLPQGTRVGISWRSGMMTAKRAKGYATLDQWGPLLSTPGAVFVNLQYDDCTLALATAEDLFGVRVHTFPDLNLRDDFEGSAGLISNLDLVITIGNAVGELSAALGVPTWRLSPSPIAEWTMLGTDRRPWFPSMRVCQARTADDWSGLVSRVASELRALSACTAAQAAA